jgi:Protein of unknown function (DUF2911)
MKIHKLYIVLGLMIALGVFYELAAHAEETNESTIITFSAPVQIPGMVLPAGTYTFERIDPNGNSNLISIFNADRSVLYATVETVSAERTEPRGEAAITLAETGSGNPVLMKLFYPGRDIGHEFVYPNQQEREIAQAAQKTFVGNQLVSSGEVAGE